MLGEHYGFGCVITPPLCMLYMLFDAYIVVIGFLRATAYML